MGVRRIFLMDTNDRPQCQEETKAGAPCTRDALWLIETPSGPGLVVCGTHKRLWLDDSPERAAHRLTHQPDRNAS